MKWLKKIIVISLFSLGLVNVVEAGTISFNNPKKISDNKYRFTLTVNDIDLNYLSGNIKITNGTLTKVTMANQWISETGNNNTFYFYRNGLGNEEPLIATFEVEMTGNSEYTVDNLKYGMLKCQKDNYGHYFGPTGNLVAASSFASLCTKSNDATLKSLSSKAGTLSPVFSSNNYSYFLQVNKYATAVFFDAIPNNEKAEVKSGKSCTLKDTITKCNIIVKSEAGTTKTYTVTVSKTKDTSTFVDNFKVHNGVLNQEFNKNTLSYKITPNEGAEYIYFSFDLNGITHESQKCSVNSSTCTLTISNMGEKRTYSFMLENNEDEIEEPNNNNNTSNTNNNNNSNNSNNNNNNNNVVNKPNDKNQTNNNKTETSKNENVQEEEEEETKDPIEENKNSNKKEEKNEVDVNDDKDNEDKKEENKANDKNNFLVILCVVNVFLGIAIGFFVKKRIYR